MRVNGGSGRIRERKFTSPAAFLLSSHDHHADCGGQGGEADQLECVSPDGDQSSGELRRLRGL